MSEYFIGQLILGGFNFAPKGFAACNGATMQITQNQALFALLGVAYGGDGIRTFKLPDLRSRVPIGFAPSRDPNWQPQFQPIGTAGGEEAVTLTVNQMPMHVHLAEASTTAAAARAPSTTTVFASSTTYTPYGADSQALVGLASATLGTVGGSQPHSNIQPLTTLNFSIALNGIWPSRS